MRVARRSNAADLSLTSSTSLDDSCDSYSTDTEGRRPHLLRSRSSNNRAASKQSQSKPLSSSLLMQQATHKIMQRRNGGGTKAGCDSGARSKILASCKIDADDDLDRAEYAPTKDSSSAVLGIERRSSNPGGKQRARIPSTVFKYMSKCDGSDRRARSATGASESVDDPTASAAAVDAVAIGAGVDAYDANAAPDDAVSKGEPVMETPKPNDAANEAPKLRQKTAVVEPQQVGTKKRTKKRHSRPSKSGRNESENVAEPPETPSLPPTGPRPKAAARAVPRTRKEKAMARMRTAKAERNKEANERRQRAESSDTVDVGASGFLEYTGFDGGESDRHTVEKKAAENDLDRPKERPARHQTAASDFGSAGGPFAKFVYCDDGNSAQNAKPKEAAGDIVHADIRETRARPRYISASRYRLAA